MSSSLEPCLTIERPWEDRTPAADLVIFNNGPETEFESEVRSRFSQVRNSWQNGELEPTKYTDWWNEQTAAGADG